MLNVSVPSVKRATVVRDHGVPELQAKVAKGDGNGSQRRQVSATVPFAGRPAIFVRIEAAEAGGLVRASAV